MSKQAELLLQKAIIDRVKEEKGYAFKLSNKFIAGIPDLYIRTRGFGTFAAEVKDLGTIAAGRSYVVPTTAIQRDTLKKIQEADPAVPATCVLVGYKIEKTRYLAACPWWAERISHLLFPTTGKDHNHSYHMSSLWWNFTEGWSNYGRT